MSAVLGIVVIYLLIRLTQQGGVIEPTSSRRVFNGFETHAIVLMDDDSNSMENVVNTLVRVIGISEKQSINFMFRTHKEGITIVWTGDKNQAERYLQNLREAGLQCCIAEIVHNSF